MTRIIRPIKVDGPWEVIAVEILGICFILFYIIKLGHLHFFHYKLGQDTYTVCKLSSILYIFCMCVIRSISWDSANREHTCGCNHWLLQQMGGGIPSAAERFHLCCAVHIYLCLQVTVTWRWHLRKCTHNAKSLQLKSKVFVPGSARWRRFTSAKQKTFVRR